MFIAGSRHNLSVATLISIYAIGVFEQVANNKCDKANCDVTFWIL